MIGISTMPFDLSGDPASVEAWESIAGKAIGSVSVTNDAVRFAMEDGTNVELFDDGQDCCEYRYLTTDDDLSAYAGATLLGAEIRDVGVIADPAADERGDVHECSFLIVKTSKGEFTVKAHNEHNGYYGGIRITARAL